MYMYVEHAAALSISERGSIAAAEDGVEASCEDRGSSGGGDDSRGSRRRNFRCSCSRSCLTLNPECMASYGSSFCHGKLRCRGSVLQRAVQDLFVGVAGSRPKCRADGEG